MKDKIEKFIADNRESFDSEVPSEKVWIQIEENMDRGKPKSYNFSSILWKAAAVFFFGLSSLLWYQNNYPSFQAKETKLLSKEFIDIENYYINQINFKRDEIEWYFGKDYLEGNYRENLGKLDAMYLVLKDEFEKNPSKEVIDALVLNLIMRIDILNEEIIKLKELEPEDDRQEASI